MYVLFTIFSQLDMHELKISLYPNFTVRVLSHLLAWIFVYWFFIITARTLFKAEVTTIPLILYSLVVLFVVLFNHYFLSLFTIPILPEIKKWPLIVIHCLLLYTFSAFITIKSLQLLAQLYPAYPSFKAQSDRRNFQGFMDLFSYTTFIWVITVIIFYNVILFFLKFAKSTYESNMTNVLLQAENTKLEMNFLRSQIQPHFLFNTLNNIYGQVLDNQRASDSILKLSDLLRFSLYESKNPFITLHRENEFLSDYVNLERMRHKEHVRIDYTFHHQADQEIMIAPLLLVNFIENSFKHGINAIIGESWVSISLEGQAEKIIFTIENNLPEDEPLKMESPGDSSGLGLANTHRRLDLIYPDKYDLTINKTQKTFFVQLIINLS